MADERWTAFVASKPQANIFHHPVWSSLSAECYGYRPFVIAVSDMAGRLTAGLPMMEVHSRLTGKRWVSLPFTDHCAPLYGDAQSLGRLVEGLVCLSNDAKMPRVEARWELPHHPGIHTYSPYVLHTVALNSDAESVARRFHRMHRRNIKVAEKKGVRIEMGDKREHMDAFYRLHLQTRRRQGVPVQPRRFFDLLGRAILETGLGFALLAYKDDRCLAAAVFLHWQKTLTYKYGASGTDSLSLRPNNLLFWTAIRWGCERGYTLLDMGRTGPENAGLRSFKSKWGAEEVLLTYSTLSATPPRSRSGKLMHVMETVIQRSPTWVCRAAGELLYRHVG
jgi:CelD/BcsL family acetyltransferase involved in cellulose biosynthesis